MNHAPHDQSSALAFAQTWAAAWNARDIEAVLGHFADGVRFSSAKAVTITGSGVVDGKAALRSYWRAALERIGQLHFTVRDALWDPAAHTISIRYRAELTGGAELGCEVLTFNEVGSVVAGDAYYGAPLA
ncbi:MAG TPA: nuclear transport factor 2 family protein [Myxococcota bacterium]